MAKTAKTNPNLQRVVQGLRDASREAGSAIWRDVADRLLNGEDIVVVNAEKAIVTGRKHVVFEEYRARHARGSTASRMRGIGPNYPRRPDMILRRTISRMMPYQQPRGREALKRLRV